MTATAAATAATASATADAANRRRRRRHPPPPTPRTSDGRHKIIDLVDCSGAGDVNVQTKRTLADDGTITALSGRKLKPPSFDADADADVDANGGAGGAGGGGGAWSNPSGDWYVGIKAGFDLFPLPLRDRVKNQRRRELDETRRELLVAANARLSALRSDDSGSGGGGGGDGGGGVGSTPGLEQELEAQIELLESQSASPDDAGRWSVVGGLWSVVSVRWSVVSAQWCGQWSVVGRVK